MGMGRHLIEAVIREHLNRPITGDVLLIGRQTTYSSPEELIQVINEFGIKVGADPSEFELDKTTIDRKGEIPRSW